MKKVRESFASLRFQFTHPGRGATRGSYESSPYQKRFNSRTPGGVRLYREVHLAPSLAFQFTHPGRGATH